jgi:hypothetical protein
VTVTPAVIKSNRSLTAIYIASQVRNRGLTSEQVQSLYGITDNEVRACVDAVDRGYV